MSELKYVPGSPYISDEVQEVGIMLNAVGALSGYAIGKEYTLAYEEAVKAYQTKKGLTATGRLDANTKAKLEEEYGALVTNAMAGYEQEEEAGGVPKYDGTPKHTPFFKEGNTEALRGNDLEIRVDFGANHPLNTTLKRVFLRSSGVEVDASGNPLFKTYDFIAQDIEESTD